MDETQMGAAAEFRGEPYSELELDQSAHAFEELARSGRDPEALRVPARFLETVRPFFRLGWATGVRTGHSGPALAGVPVDSETIDAAFATVMAEAVANRLALETARRLPNDSPALWQKVTYHGSVARRHGDYWVVAMHIYNHELGYQSETRYDLGRVVGTSVVPLVMKVRRQSLTPHEEYYWHS
ncbi:hypothetical protein ACFV06_21165 [Streptomyces sp. NPDC059618]|uniref:hypothetical protein n=1 Tax=Streptomyces sp. NPDC059618 TaxID=3346887 RepID=UPI00368E611B